ncbi:MAG TPA: hypothetical protein VH723_02410 [Candidatus Limnocylindrales bacterium]
MDARPNGPFDRLLPVSEDYATLPVRAAFTWESCADRELEGEWYLVAFRSVQKPSADQELLNRMDEAAHAEVTAAPGFVHYFKGPLTARRECLSFCLWDGRSEARRAAGGPAHVAAIGIIGETYERYTLEFLRVTKGPGEAAFRFEPWDRPVHGQAGRMTWAGKPAALPRPSGA